VPGRIEFLGKHTDYAGGRSLVCATEQGFTVKARSMAEPVLRIANPAARLSAELPMHPDLPISRGDWSAYPATVVRRLARDFGPLNTGLDLSFTSDLPQDAGLSSSSALVVATALAVTDANDLTRNPRWQSAIPDRESLAGYLGAVENGRAFGPFAADGGVGTQGGSQDQTAILCSRSGQLIQVGFDPVRFERAVPFPAVYGLVVGVSGVVAAKTREALLRYNGLAETAGELLRLWRAATGRIDPSLFAALNSAPDAGNQLHRQLAGHPEQSRLEARLDQFSAECFSIIPEVGDRLARGDAAGIGPLIDRSQAGAESGLGNQIPETVHLQRSARRLGALAASAFGAGFGGSVWALVADQDLEQFQESWREEYVARFPVSGAQSSFFITRPGPPAVAWHAEAGPDRWSGLTHG
jgi:galactokinase